jgi:hypothetical protein
MAAGYTATDALLECISALSCCFHKELVSRSCSCCKIRQPRLTVLVAGDAQVACTVDVTPVQGYTWAHVTAAAADHMS